MSSCPLACCVLQEISRLEESHATEIAAMEEELVTAKRKGMQMVKSLQRLHQQELDKLQAAGKG